MGATVGNSGSPLPSPVEMASRREGRQIVVDLARDRWMLAFAVSFALITIMEITVSAYLALPFEALAVVPHDRLVFRGRVGENLHAAAFALVAFYRSRWAWRCLHARCVGLLTAQHATMVSTLLWGVLFGYFSLNGWLGVSTAMALALTLKNGALWVLIRKAARAEAHYGRS